MDPMANGQGSLARQTKGEGGKRRPVGTEADLCDSCHRPLVSGASSLVHLGVGGRSVMVSITTIIVFMLAAALVFAGLLWSEWGHE